MTEYASSYLGLIFRADWFFEEINFCFRVNYPLDLIG